MLPPDSGPKRIFLLSPANIAGIRAAQVMSGHARSDLAIRLRDGGAPLGEVFSFISGLYFRGKLAYARSFAEVPPAIPGAFVITAGGGLVPPEALVTLEPCKVQSCAYSTDGAGEHIVKHQSRYGNLGRGAAHGVTHDPVHPASHKHTAALDVHCPHRIRK
jgi:hypothetical protein